MLSHSGWAQEKLDALLDGLHQDAHEGNFQTYFARYIPDAIFLGTDNSLIKINKRTGLVSDYEFPFIGRVYNIIVDGKEIWLGTSNGLIKFLWKRHL